MTQNGGLPDSLSGWKQLYQAAVIELDYGKLQTRIADARRAIHGRATQTESFVTEHQALNDALRILQILEDVAQREKLSA